jgi:hypothetical protein
MCAELFKVTAATASERTRLEECTIINGATSQSSTVLVQFLDFEGRWRLRLLK